MDSLFCPHCGSTNLHAHKKGYNGASGFLGAVTFGALGAFAGTHGSNNIEITCLACGRKYKPGQLLRQRPSQKQIQYNYDNDITNSYGFKIFGRIWMIVVLIGFVWLLVKCG